jgi:hypothetical protein
MAALSGPLIVIRYRGIATAGIQVQRHGRLHHDLRPGKDPLIGRTSSAGQAKRKVATVLRSRRRELRRDRTIEPSNLWRRWHRTRGQSRIISG